MEEEQMDWFRPQLQNCLTPYFPPSLSQLVVEYALPTIEFILQAKKKVIEGPIPAGYRIEKGQCNICQVDFIEGLLYDRFWPPRDNIFYLPIGLNSRNHCLSCYPAI